MSSSRHKYLLKTFIVTPDAGHLQRRDVQTHGTSSEAVRVSSSDALSYPQVSRPPGSKEALRCHSRHQGGTQVSQQLGPMAGFREESTPERCLALKHAQKFEQHY